MTTLNERHPAVDLSRSMPRSACEAARAQAQAKFDASLTAAHDKLEALKPLLQQATFHMTGNSHIDAAWLWPLDRDRRRGQAHLRHRSAIDV